MDKFKYHCFHFYILNMEIWDTLDLLEHIGKSDVNGFRPDNESKAWAYLGNSILLKYHNYFKDWKQAKLLCDKPYVVEQMNEWFASIEDQWPDIDAYLNEIISHAFGR